MSLLQPDRFEAMKLLSDLLEREAWLISVTISSSGVEMICEFAASELDVSVVKKLSFVDISRLDFIYKQAVFGTRENDISTIDMARIRKDGDVGTQGQWHLGLDFTYGKLKFSFCTVEITDWLGQGH